MVFPQGGTAKNLSAKSKKGMGHGLSCSICKRRYAVREHLERHEKQCREYNKVV